jgi:alkylhydroperoxidase family enzyme
MSFKIMVLYRSTRAAGVAAPAAGKWNTHPVSHHIPRLEFDQLDRTLAAALEPRLKRLGYLGEFFRVMGHQPAALKGFIDFTEAAKSGLEKRLVELLALTAATHFHNLYERHQHERLSIRSGFGRPWVQAVERLEPETAPGLTEAERRLQQFALESIRSHGRAGRERFDALVQEIGPTAAVAALMIIARYIAHAYMSNVLQLEPPVPSIWDDGFAG